MSEIGKFDKFVGVLLAQYPSCCGVAILHGFDSQKSEEILREEYHERYDPDNDNFWENNDLMVFKSKESHKKILRRIIEQIDNFGAPAVVQAIFARRFEDYRRTSYNKMYDYQELYDILTKVPHTFMFENEFNPNSNNQITGIQIKMQDLCDFVEDME